MRIQTQAISCFASLAKEDLIVNYKKEVFDKHFWILLTPSKVLTGQSRFDNVFHLAERKVRKTSSFDVTCDRTLGIDANLCRCANRASN